MWEKKVKIINSESIVTLSVYCIPLTLLFVSVFFGLQILLSVFKD